MWCYLREQILACSVWSASYKLQEKISSYNVYTSIDLHPEKRRIEIIVNKIFRIDRVVSNEITWTKFVSLTLSLSSMGPAMADDMVR